MTIKELIGIATKKIGYINAKNLMMNILNKDIKYIIINENMLVGNTISDRYLNYVSKIENGYPLQYVINKAEFMGLSFFVNEDVLIPQPDTEVLVEKAIEFAKKIKKCKILDLCTGSGAIAISIKKYVLDAEVFASDISQKALDVATKNAKNNNTDIKFLKSDMFENIKDTFDIIVTNPPYIKTNIICTLPKDVQNEPKVALDGGIDGLKYYKIIAKDIKKYLKPRGTLLMEIGYDQEDKVTNLFEGSTCIKDYTGLNRVVIWKHFQKK